MYRPEPLTPERVDAALADRVEDALTVAAAEAPAAGPPLDLADGLSPDDAAVVATLLSPELRALRARTGVAGAQLFQAGLLPDPALSLGVDPVVFGQTVNEYTAWNVGLAWDLQALVTRPARVDAAERTLGQVRLDVAWAEWRVALAARQAVRDLQAYLAQRELAAGSGRPWTRAT